MRAALARLWAATIWAPGAVPESEGEVARDLKRWVLPLVDTALIIASALGVRGGMPTFALVYNETVSQVAAIAVLVAAIGCLVGVAVPRWWALEVGAKCALVFVLLLYAVLLLALASDAYPARGFVAGVCVAVSVLPVYRIIWLGNDYRKRKDAEQATLRPAEREARGAT